MSPQRWCSYIVPTSTGKQTRVLGSHLYWHFTRREETDKSQINNNFSEVAIKNRLYRRRRGSRPAESWAALLWRPQVFTDRWYGQRRRQTQTDKGKRKGDEEERLFIIWMFSSPVEVRGQQLCVTQGLTQNEDRNPHQSASTLSGWQWAAKNPETPSRGRTRSRSLWSSPAPCGRESGARAAASKSDSQPWTPGQNYWRLPFLWQSGQTVAGLSSGEGRPSPSPKGDSDLV